MSQSPIEENRAAPQAWRMPDAYIIIFFVVVLAAAATYVIPAGFFETERRTYVTDDGSTRSRVVPIPESFQIAKTPEGEPLFLTVSLFSGEADLGDRRVHYFPGNASGDTGLFNYLFEGMTAGTKYGSAVGVIAFILVIGGAFGIIMRTGAVENGILLLIRKARFAHGLLIPALFISFSLGGAIFGMSEEAIAFAMLLVPLFIALGYDSLTAVMVTYLATQIGFATSWMNPFGVGIAQGLADVPVMSGAPFRMGLWLVFTLVGLAYVLWHARRVKAHPELSPTHASDTWFREREDALAARTDNPFQPGHGIVLGMVGLGVVWIVYGVVRHQFFIPEIATQFFIIGLACGVTGVICRLEGMRLNDIASSFRKGASDLLGAALIVGMGKGIIIMLGGDQPGSPSVLNTVLHHAGGVIGPLPEWLSVAGMFFFQGALNFFVPSGSGQAALTMPIMAPLADLAGVERQMAVLAFQLGDGLTNLIIPTSAALMGTLAVARIDYLVWIRFIFRLQLILGILAMGALGLGLLVGLR